MERDHAAQLDGHDEEGQEKDIEHAPFAGDFHGAEPEGAVVAAEHLEQRQFEHDDKLEQRKDDGKDKDDAADEPLALHEQVADAFEDAGLVAVAHLFNRQDGQQHGGPEQHERGGRESRAPAGHALGGFGARYRSPAPGTHRPGPRFQFGNLLDEVA